MLFILLLGCAGQPLSSDTLTYAAPSEPAPYLAGTDTFDVPTEQGITLNAQVWFPAKEVGQQPHRYDDLVEGGINKGGVPDCSSTRPAVIYSHGDGSSRYAALYLAERLAARGFLFAAPDHLGNTMFDYGDVPFEELLLRRPADIAATWEALVAASERPDDPLNGCVDPEAGFFVVGHSFGGYTALGIAGANPDVAKSAEFCANYDSPTCSALEGWMEDWLQEFPDTRGPELAHPDVRGVIVHAPAGYEFLLDSVSLIEVPALILGALEDSFTPWETVEPLFDGLTLSPRGLGVFSPAGHHGFSNAFQLASIYEGLRRTLLAC